MQSSPVAKKASGDRLPGHFNGKATQFPNALTLPYIQEILMEDNRGRASTANLNE
jgi:hypothetical protein